MKQFFFLVVFCFGTLVSFSQKNDSLSERPDASKKIYVVEASCGQCKFHMPGKGCHLAVRINGNTYFVDGADIDSFGDAHGSDGFCMAIRKAEVQGEVVNNRFKLAYFKLLKTGDKTSLTNSPVSQ
ncbi:MAG: hypothetical protein HZB42_06115 [Sphingobacteriales bacterium]|nr:hypothetical protein [Sphingobacteriales bacterium]